MKAEHPVEFLTELRIVRRYCVRMAVHRGILAQAKAICQSTLTSLAVYKNRFSVIICHHAQKDGHIHNSDYGS